MRRPHQEIVDRAAVDAVIRRSQVCRLGLSDAGEPYVIPLCFGYDGKVLYFHCSREGRKLDILRRNNRVCFEFDVVEGLVEAEQACGWSIRYQSVIGFGTASEVEDAAEKERALTLLMEQYSDRRFTLPAHAIDRTAIIRLDIREMTGKQSRR